MFVDAYAKLCSASLTPIHTHEMRSSKVEDFPPNFSPFLEDRLAKNNLVFGEFLPAVQRLSLIVHFVGLVGKGTFVYFSTISPYFYPLFLV